MLPKNIKNILANSSPISVDSEKKKLAKKLVNKAYASRKEEIGLALGAAFDLLVSVEYYAKVTNKDWVYCPHRNEPLLLFPYTNVCPRCILKNEFVYHKSNKPSSGSIGTIAVDLLALMLKILFEKHGRKIEIYKASEPADLIFYDKKNNVILFAEVKSSPLTTLPLATITERQTEENESGVVESGHLTLNNTDLSSKETKIFLPVISKGNKRYKLFNMGIIDAKSKNQWAYQGIGNLLNSSFFEHYLSFWLHALNVYEDRRSATGESADSIYWFTNACGHPWPKPANWPQRSSGGGYESISDSKTSVGMDRTDDIKKGTYQVLKLGATNKFNAGPVSVKTGLLSNLHAIRHFDDYLQDLKDVVWTKDETGKVERAKDLPPDTELYSLYDGIVSFSSTYARDEWIKNNFRF